MHTRLQLLDVTLFLLWSSPYIVRYATAIVAKMWRLSREYWMQMYAIEVVALQKEMLLKGVYFMYILCVFYLPGLNISVHFQMIFWIPDIKNS